MSNHNENKNNKGVLILLVLSLLGNAILGYLFFTTNQEKQIITIEKEKTSAELDSIIDIRVALETELTATKADLDKFKGYSAELDSLLSAAREELAIKEKRIAALSRDNKKLKELQKELEELKRMRDALLEQVDRLVQENNLLKKENQEYQATISDLKIVKSDLEKKVESGSVLTANNVVVIGYKEKGSGKKSPTVIAKKTDLVDVCFDLVQNRIAPPGNKEVYVRIISPEGSTLAVQSLGSGTFKDKESGQENLYTAKKTVAYDGTTKNHCITWRPNMPFASGKYKAEVYVDGYLAGAGGLILK